MVQLTPGSFCTSCGRRGTPYVYKGRIFDGLHPNRGERLCSPCLDRVYDAVLAEWAEAIPVTVARLKDASRGRVPPSTVQPREPEPAAPVKRTDVRVHTRPVSGCVACMDPERLATWLAGERRRAAQIAGQAAEIRAAAERADRAAGAADSGRDLLAAQAEQRRLHGQANMLSQQVLFIRDRADRVEAAHPRGELPAAGSAAGQLDLFAEAVS